MAADVMQEANEADEVLADHRLRNLIALLVGAALIRILWIVVSPSFPVSDWADYFALAQGIERGDGYVNARGPTAFRPVGYPAYLALGMTVLGTGLKAAQWMNVLASVATVWFGFRIAEVVWNRRVAYWAAGALAVMPSLVLFTAVIASETLVAAAVAGGVLALVLTWDGGPGYLLPLAGLAFGVAALSSPGYLVMPALFLFVPGLATVDRIKRLAVVGVAMALVVVPWTARNAVRLDEFVPVSTNGGFNFAMSFFENADGRYRGDVTEVLLGETYDWETNGLVGSDLVEYEIDRELYAAGFDDLSDNPERLVTLAPPKLIATFADDVSAVEYNFIDPGPSGERVASLLRLVAQAFYMVIMVLAVVGLLRRVLGRGPDTRHGALLLVPVLFTVGLHSIFIGSDRFHLPILVFAVGMAAATLTSAIDGWHLRRGGAKGAPDPEPTVAAAPGRTA